MIINLRKFGTNKNVLSSIRKNVISARNHKINVNSFILI